MGEKPNRIHQFFKTIEESPDVIISKVYKDETVFNFGKYREKTFKWVMDNDRTYVTDYCLTYKYLRDNPGFTFTVNNETKRKYNLLS